MSYTVRTLKAFLNQLPPTMEDAVIYGNFHHFNEGTSLVDAIYPGFKNSKTGKVTEEEEVLGSDTTLIFLHY